MYEIIIDEEAIDFLNTLEKQQKERIFNKMMAARENPFHFFDRLAQRTDYKLRVGDYRIIADIDLGKKKIEGTQIGHRKNIYKQP